MGNTCWGLSLSRSSHGVRSMADGGMTLFLSSHLSGVPGFSSSLAPLVVSAKNVTVATTLQWKWSQRGGGGGCCWCLLQQVCPTTRDSLTSEDRTLLQDRSEIRDNLLVSPPTKRNHWSEDRNHQPQIRAEMQLRRQSSWIHTQTHFIALCWCQCCILDCGGRGGADGDRPPLESEALGLIV